MMRTESKVRKVHPDNEQSTIEFMQLFHWNLANSQHVKNKTQSSHLERRGDDLYSVTQTESEHFVNLTFSRDLDAPGIGRIKALEAEYHEVSGAIPSVPTPKGYVAPVIVCLLLVLVGAASAQSGGVIMMLLAVGVGVLWFRKISRTNKDVEIEMPGIMARRERAKARLVQIEEECRRPTS